jgi:hypothetical protein
MTAYDVLIEKMEQYEAKPYCIRMGRRDWTELRRDKRTLAQLAIAPGDHVSFMGVPVRIERGRISKIPQKFDALIYETDEQLHEALYGK